MSNDPSSSPGSLDFAEWFLKRVLIAAVALLAIVLLIVWGMRTFGPAGRAGGTPPTAASATTNPGETKPAGVMLVIEHASNVRLTYPSLPVGENATVMDVLKAAENSASRSLKVESSGSGQTAFVRAIDGVANESGRTGRYWQFSVNGQYAQTGAGVTPVRPGDTVTFTFGVYASTGDAPAAKTDDASGQSASPNRP